MPARKSSKPRQTKRRVVDEKKEGGEGKMAEGNQNPSRGSANEERGLPRESSVKQRRQQGRVDTRRTKRGLQEEADMCLGDSARAAASLDEAQSDFPTFQELQERRVKIVFPPKLTWLQIVETVGIPVELNEWASGLNCSNILLDVKQKSGVKSIYIADKGIEEREVFVVGTEPGSIHVAKLMLQTHFRNECESNILQEMVKGFPYSQDSTKYESGLNAFQKELSYGLHLQFSAPSHLIGLSIGKKGVRIKAIEADSGCNIHISNTGVVNISGPSPDDVELAREKFEMSELQKGSECIIVKVVKLASPAELKEVSGVPEIDESAVEPSNDGPFSPSLTKTTPWSPWYVRLVGGKLNIANCKILLDITLGYLEKRQELQEQNRELVQHFRSVQGEFGNMRPVYNGERGGNRGSRRGGWGRGW